jgi:hypothetical protein
MAPLFESRSCAILSDDIHTWTVPNISIWYIGPYTLLHSKNLSQDSCEGTSWTRPMNGRPTEHLLAGYAFFTVVLGSLINVGPLTSRSGKAASPWR